MDTDTLSNQGNEVSSNSNLCKIRKLLNKDVLHQKSVPLSPSFSLSPEFHPKDEMVSLPVTEVKRKKVRIRKKTERRIDVLSDSPQKGFAPFKRRHLKDVDKSGSSDDLGAITWGTEKSKSELNTHQEKTDIEKELQSLLTVSKNRQHESSSQYHDSNSSLAGLESEISLTQQIHSLQESANSLLSTDLVLPVVSDKVPPAKCLTFVEGVDKEGSGMDSMLDSSILEEVDRLEAEAVVLNDTDLLRLVEDM